MSEEEITVHEAEDDPRNQHILIYVNGNIVPRPEAKISVYDSGFMLGDGVWEGLRFYNGKWAFLDEHMLDVHGFVSTTNSCNFFIVREGEVWTSNGDYCLNGITRQKVIDVCRADGIPVFEKNFSLVEVYGADEAFLTGTFGAQIPVGEIDGRTIGQGEVGDMTKKIRSLYFELIDK